MQSFVHSHTVSEEASRTLYGHMVSLEPRLSVPDFVLLVSDFSPKLRDKIHNRKPGFEASHCVIKHTNPVCVCVCVYVCVCVSVCVCVCVCACVCVCV